MIKPALRLVQARSPNPADTCFEMLLRKYELTFNEIGCEYSHNWRQWFIDSCEYDSYTRTPKQEAQWLKVVEQYVRNFEEDIK